MNVTNLNLWDLAKKSGSTNSTNQIQENLNKVLDFMNEFGTKSKHVWISFKLQRSDLFESSNRFSRFVHMLFFFLFCTLKKPEINILRTSRETLFVQIHFERNLIGMKWILLGENSKTKWSYHLSLHAYQQTLFFVQQLPQLKLLHLLHLPNFCGELQNF